MGATQMIQPCGQTNRRNQSADDSASERSSLAAVTGFLNAALRIWDDDRTQAKSQIKIAAAMLHGYTDESVPKGTHAGACSDTRGLAPWQTRKVREFIEASLDSTIRIPDCASRAHLSASYFSHVFKVTFGTTVCRYSRPAARANVGAAAGGNRACLWFRRSGALLPGVSPTWRAKPRTRGVIGIRSWRRANEGGG
jgi:hypothetical protein